ncbi:DNA-directed RNA polymerase subunit beta [Hirschfeldia incana]|nr:DNA-directed RNA polymerase subunit beta [Hirschfeldia incana]
MTEDSGESAPPPGEIRTALRNLTNLQKKRGASSISSDEKSGDGNSSRVDFSKRLCVVVDDLVKQNGSSSSSDSKCSSDEKGSGGDATTVEVSKPLKEIYFEPGDRDGARELNTDEGLALTVLSRSSDAEVKKELGRSFEMSRCSNVNKEEEHVNVVNMGDDDLIKSCSCSFCLKAAYIWSDLHYQDIKGRLSALKKSQKVASSLIQRNDQEKSKDLHALVNSVGAGKLEADLMGQWRSLFLSMGDILAHESNHLQNSFTTMKDLREDCKIDLERATKTPQHNTR